MILKQGVSIWARILHCKMEIRPSLDIRGSLKTVITNELRQSIELLQLSTVELAEKIEKELLENPFLEEQEPVWSREAVEGVRDSYRFDSTLSDNHQAMMESSPESESIYSHVLEQLRLMDMEPVEWDIAEMLVSMLDEHGLIKATSKSIADDNGYRLSDVEKVRNMFSSLDPAGVGAENIVQSLLIQAEVRFPGNELLQRVIAEHLADMEKRDFRKIARELQVKIEEVEEAYHQLLHLEPYPSALYTFSKPDYIIPDVKISEENGEFSIFINDEWIPKPVINNEYRKYMKMGLSEKDEKYMKEKLYLAQWLLRSIEQRRNTLIKVVDSIIHFQNDFFRRGVSAIKPLKLKDIAERIEMHESTVSRITTNKYMETPYGIYELKWFFSSSVQSASGDQSSRKIQDEIRNMVKTEDEKNPLSDNDIVELMKKQGIEIARRTVTKYRKIMNILPSNLRKKK